MFYAKQRLNFIVGNGVMWAVILLGLGISNTVAQPVIQEVLYDGHGVDTDDVFTEILGPAGMVLEGWSLVGLNGENGEVYRTVDLSGAIIPADGVLVIATHNAIGTVLAQRDWIGTVDWQNGPDAVQLRNGQNELVDALQYGEAASFNRGEGGAAPLTPAGASLARDAISTDTGDNAADFMIVEMPTPGSVGGEVIPGATITVPDTVALYGQSLALPVHLNTAVGDITPIVAAEVFLSYDRNIINVDSLISPLSTWSLVHHVVPGVTSSIDTLKMALATGTEGLTNKALLLTIYSTLSDTRIPAQGALQLEYVLLNDGQPTVTALDGRIRRLGNDGQINVLPAQLVLPDTVKLEIFDEDADLNPNALDQVKVQIATVQDSAGFTLAIYDNEEILLEETEPTSGIFKAKIVAMDGTVEHNDGVIQLAHGAAIRLCYIDCLDASGKTLERCVKVAQQSGNSGSIAATAVVQPGDTLRVRVADTDLNADPTVQETLVVQVSATALEDTLALALTEVGMDSGVFFARMLVGEMSGLVVSHGDTIYLSYIDRHDIFGQRHERRVETRVVGLFGDVDGNGQVQAFDAAKILEHALSAVLVGVDSLAANVDSFAPQGDVTPFDAALILQYRVGLRRRFPVQEDGSDNHPQVIDNQALVKAARSEYVLALKPGPGYFTVLAEQRSGITSGEIVLTGVHEGRAEMAPGLGHFLSAQRIKDGLLHIVFAGAAPLYSPGPLIRVYHNEAAIKPQLLRAAFNDGRITGRTSFQKQPSNIVLDANFPNPFNPQTTIRFTLDKSTWIRLEVFNSAGQQIRRLADTVWVAGTHQVLWDGTDKDGRAVGSGVYFYRLYTGFSNLTRPMLLIR